MDLLEPEETKMNKANPAATTMHRLKDVCLLTGLKKTSIYKLIRIGDFPSPVRIGVRAVAWRHLDLERWSASRLVTLAAVDREELK